MHACATVAHSQAICMASDKVHELGIVTSLQKITLCARRNLLEKLRQKIASEVIFCLSFGTKMIFP